MAIAIQSQLRSLDLIGELSLFLIKTVAAPVFELPPSTHFIFLAIQGPLEMITVTTITTKTPMTLEPPPLPMPPLSIMITGLSRNFAN
jgi:hypothetical protein